MKIRLFLIAFTLLCIGFVMSMDTTSTPTAHAQTAFDCDTVTEIPQIECEALVALYESTDGVNWTDDSGWLDISTPCAWNGIMCNAGAVTQINLWQNQLSGAIPSELGNLTSLTGLSLARNQLSGSIPLELGSLTSLTSLGLEYNQLSGSIPSDLGNLISLTSLTLGNNDLTGSIPSGLGNLTSLTALGIDSNQLSGTIPVELGNLTSLTLLALNSNQLSGTIPVELGNLTLLTFLFLNENQLTENIPLEFGNITSLQGLSLGQNQLSGSIPLEYAQLGNLEYFHFETSDLCIPQDQAFQTWLNAIPDLNSTNRICGSFSCNNVTQIPVNECEALVTLYESTDGANWTNNSGWLDTIVPCSWYGIQCQNGSLIQLQLDSNRLSGSIPSELGSLSTLEHLYLRYNQLSGNIPPELGALASLQSLSLNGNQLSGSIPPELGSLLSLKELFLNENQLNGNIPLELRSLSSLEALWLFKNQLSGSIPPELGNLSSLRSLSLHTNELSGSIPPELGSLSSLQGLYLFSNQLSGKIPPELGNLSSLTSLWLYLNQLTGNAPPELANLSSLKTLSLSDNQLTGSLPLEYAQLSNLELFHFTITDLCVPADSVFQAWLNAIPNLGSTNVICDEQGVFSCNNVTEIPQSECEALVVLYESTDGTNWIDNSDWLDTATPCSWFGVACQNNKVTYLDLNDNQLNGTIASELGNLSALEYLYLFNNELSGNIPAELGSLTSLLEMAVGNNQLSGNIPPELGNLTSLWSLRLDNNQLSGSIPPELGNLSSLTLLYLWENQLSGGIPVELSNLDTLQSLELSRNQLSGTIPSELGNLSSLQSMYLMGNQLSGSIPPELGDLSSLVVLNLFFNQLSGDIPTELENLSSLQSLILSWNQLNGSIPTELANLSSLKFLYVDTNPLTGSIPIEYTQLDNLEEFKFSNTQLCIPQEAVFQTWLNGLNAVDSNNNSCLVNTPTPIPTNIPTPLPTDTPTPVPTDTPTPIPIDTPTPVPTNTPIPTDTPTPVPTDTPTPIPTDTPTPVPTNTPTPTDTSTPEPTASPTSIPTNTPIPTEIPVVDLQVSPKGPTLKVERGMTTQLEISVTNRGNRATGNLSVVQPPHLRWAIATLSDQAPIAPDASGTLQIEALPPTSLPAGYYRDFVEVRDSNGNSDFVALTVHVTLAQRPLQIQIQNDQGQIVAGAALELRKQQQDLVVTEGVSTSINQVYNAISDETGLIQFDDLDVGPYSYSITASNHAGAEGTITIGAGSDTQNEFLQLVAQPLLSVSPQSPVVGIVQGERASQTIAVTNQGEAPLQGVTLVLPESMPWLTVGIPDTTTITAGQVLEYTLLVSPNADVSSGIYQDYVTVSAQGLPPQQVALTVEITEDNTRDLSVVVTDGANQPITSGRIQLIEQALTSQITAGVASQFNQQYSELVDTNGSTLFSSLRPGEYNYTILADGYFPREGTITVHSGSEVQIKTIVLQPSPFDYSWSVVPTDQSYDITLTLTYDTRSEGSPRFLMPDRRWTFDVCSPAPINDFIQLYNISPITLTLDSFAPVVPGVEIEVGDYPNIAAPESSIRIPISATLTNQQSILDSNGAVDLPVTYQAVEDDFVTFTVNPSSIESPLFAIVQGYSESFVLEPAFFRNDVQYAVTIEQPEILEWITVAPDQVESMPWNASTQIALQLNATPPTWLAEGVHQDRATIVVQGDNGTERTGYLAVEVTRTATDYKIYTSFDLASIPYVTKSSSSTGNIITRIRDCNSVSPNNPPTGNVSDGNGWNWSYISGGLVGRPAGGSGQSSTGTQSSPPRFVNFVPPPAYNYDHQQVRIQIDQRLVLEGEGFNATLLMDNTSTSPLETVSVNIRLLDNDGIEQPERFVITPTLPTPLGMIAVGEDAAKEWSILPANIDVVDPLGESYDVIADIVYRWNGAEYTLSTEPETITVYPAPELEITYQLPPANCTSQEFDLKTIIHNVGRGPARNLRFSSSQPSIVDNQSGLNIGFRIIETFINGETAGDTLNLSLGNLAPNEQVEAIWRIAADREGRFVEFTSDYRQTTLGQSALAPVISKISTEFVGSDMCDVSVVPMPTATPKPNPTPTPLETPIVRVQANPSVVPANGKTPAIVEILLTTQNGNPVVGEEVRLVTNRGGVDLITNLTSFTDDSGIVLAEVRSFEDGEVKVSIWNSSVGLIAVDVVELEFTEFSGIPGSLDERIENLHKRSNSGIKNILEDSEAIREEAVQARGRIAERGIRTVTSGLSTVLGIVNNISSPAKAVKIADIVAPGGQIPNGVSTAVCEIGNSGLKQLSDQSGAQLLLRTVLRWGLLIQAAKESNGCLVDLVFDDFADEPLIANLMLGYLERPFAESALPKVANDQLFRLQQQRQRLIDLPIPTLPEDKVAAYDRDLLARTLAIQAYEERVRHTRWTVESIRQANETGPFGGHIGQTSLRIGAQALAISWFDGAGKLATDGLLGAFDTYMDRQSLSEYIFSYAKAKSALMQESPISIAAIGDNAVAGMAQIERGIIPLTPKGEILEVQHISKLSSWDKFWKEDEAYSLVTIRNTGQSVATFQVTASYLVDTTRLIYPYSSLQLQTEELATLQPGEESTQKLVYKNQWRGYAPRRGRKYLLVGELNPDLISIAELEPSLISVNVIAINRTGSFFVDADITQWSPQTLLPQVRSAEVEFFTSRNLLTEEVDNQLIIDEPIVNFLSHTKPDMLTGRIWVNNPYTQTINVSITQAVIDGMSIESTSGELSDNIILWQQSIPAFSTQVFTYTADHNFVSGAEVSLLPARLDLISPATNKSISRESNKIEFEMPWNIYADYTPPSVIQPGLDSSVAITLTNDASSDLVGDVTLTIVDSDGVELADIVESISLVGNASEQIKLSLPNLPDTGYYLVEATFETGNDEVYLFDRPLQVGAESPTISFVSEPEGVVSPGEDIQYSFTLTNENPINLNNVQMVLSIPTGLDFVDTGLEGVTLLNDEILWTIDSMAVDQIQTLNLTFQVTETETPLLEGRQWLASQLTVTSDESVPMTSTEIGSLVEQRRESTYLPLINN